MTLFRGLLLLSVLTIGIGTLARRFLYIVEIRGFSMTPTLRPKDRILVLRRWPARYLRRGQIVVWELESSVLQAAILRAENQGSDIAHFEYRQIMEATTDQTGANLLVKRIVALQNEILVPDDEALAARRRTASGASPTIDRIPPQCCFLKGDHTQMSFDSYDVGPVRISQLRGIMLGKLTNITQKQPTPEPNIPEPTAPFRACRWYSNSTRTVWVGLHASALGEWYSGWRHTVAWDRKSGKVQVSGRCLEETDSHSFAFEVPAGVPVAGLYIPGPGRWEISVQTEGDSFSFVVNAYPLEYAPAAIPFTKRYVESPQQLISAADAIALGRVVASAPLCDAFTQHTVALVRVWNGRVVKDAVINVLQNREKTEEMICAREVVTFREPQLEINRHYILFLEQRRRNLWRIIEPDSSIGEVKQGGVVPLTLTERGVWHWHGETMEEADQKLSQLLSDSYSPESSRKQGL